MSERDQLLTLIQKYADGVATADEVAWLQARLRDDHGHRRLFREYMELDAALERAAAFQGLAAANRPSADQQPAAPHVAAPHAAAPQLAAPHGAVPQFAASHLRQFASTIVAMAIFGLVAFALGWFAHEYPLGRPNDGAETAAAGRKVHRGAAGGNASGNGPVDRGSADGYGADGYSADSQAADSQAADSQAADSQAAGSETANSRTANSRTANSKTAGSYPAGSYAAGKHSAGSHSAGGRATGVASGNQGTRAAGNAGGGPLVTGNAGTRSRAAVVSSLPSPFNRALNAASSAAAQLTAATVAVVTRDVGAQWGPGAGPADASLVPGTYDLREGTVEVAFRSGAKAVLVGPARLDVHDASHVSLNTGRVRVTVPEGPDEGSFRVDTPTSRLADAGTEYGVEVQPSGCSLVQVYEGELSASAKVESRWQPEEPIGEGRALRFGDGMEEVPFWPERFVQLLPGPEAPEGRGSLPYNRSRYRSITVAAAPSNLVIDGDLSDWNLSHRIRAACEPPYAEHYYLEGTVLYDREYLYVGAHVGDPHPLRGKISPLEHANRHGLGGAVSLRISTDRQAGWPLRAENVVARLGRPAGPQDLSDKLAFVVMWYYAPAQLSCLHLRYGMDMHSLKVNPEGYRGAFRADADGRGYTLEYAIPWKLLNAADDPPRAGDELGFMFLTHWSDADGKKWQGQLIDVTDPDEHGFNFERAATWGKAIYQSPAPTRPTHPHP